MLLEKLDRDLTSTCAQFTLCPPPATIRILRPALEALLKQACSNHRWLLFVAGLNQDS
jgi:hypothetical protein